MPRFTACPLACLSQFETLGSKTSKTQLEKMPDPPPKEFDTVAGESFPDIYAHMKQLVAAFLQNTALTSNKTPSSILHEAWVRAAETAKDVQRTEAADERLSLTNALYSVLRDHAQQMREAGELKSGFVPITFSLVDDLVQSHDGTAFAIDMLWLDEALVKFRKSYPDHAQFLQLYFFSGMSMAECAAALNVSHRTAERYWQFSKAWMNRELTNNS